MSLALDIEAILSTDPSGGLPFAAREEAEDSSKVFVDRDHDGPWMSCMSLDGRTMYVNSSLPEQVIIGDKEVVVAEVLRHHEVAEWEDIQRQIKELENAARGKEAGSG